ncbi:PLP-dependent aminotransferase family protein [Cohnella thailandensis]|uniref:PLP-dependent aminotransferase family protein n=1 Tax=Cohnella thailandensis TaxID=557557 RepID=A0A841T3S7_9BACL|nr:PLP-dependent aminotransferase family protein [Cohnella thailandensis]MBB6637496.1 PLP-dependent aminotransferase family protein [Cohnella thailandensis]MBP1977529.1 GntR family transcriptional regulator/MocR family aminotransferase [Cohnella thailandensis]
MFGFNPIAGEGSLIKQLCGYLRDTIASGALSPGHRLPPTRKAAQELGIARNIVIEVYEQLTAEGYLTSKAGSGTFIAEGIEIHSPALDPSPVLPAQATPLDPAAPREKPIDFDAGTPDLSLFPRRLWSKYVREVVDSEPANAFAYGDIQGTLALREAVADYLLRVKGIRCGTERIVIASGTAEAFLLLASAFSDRHRTVYVEEPTIGFVGDIFRKMKYDVRPVHVDRQGMNISRIERSEPGGLIVLTPSHQYPTGSILSIQRRQQAVALAETYGHYIIEDDYNSEFRHKGGPVPPLQLLAPSRVIYAGTFSKTLSPALRIGFLIVPPQLIELVVRTKEELNLTASAISQLALARFIMDGHYDRHIHKMRAVYKRKRLFLAEQCHRLFGDRVEVIGDEAGMHVQLVFRQDSYGPIEWQKLESCGVRLSSFDDYAMTRGRNPGKAVLGYGNLTEEEIVEGLRRLSLFTDAWRI